MTLWTDNFRQNVLCVIFNNKEEILIGKNSIGKTTWTFPKWGKNSGETNIDAVYREIKEELNLEKHHLDLIFVDPNRYNKLFTQEQIQWKIENKGEYYIWKSEEIHYLLYKVGEINVAITGELSEYKWVKVNQLNEFIKHKDLLETIDVMFLEKLIEKFKHK